MKIKMNKRGDISTLVLVIGVFLVCAVAIISLSISLASTQKEFDVLQAMVSVNSISDQVRFYENMGLNPTDFLDIKKEAGYYTITSEVKGRDDKRMIYVEYRIPVKTPAFK